MGKTEKVEFQLHFGPSEAEEADRLIRLALDEDIPGDDITTRSLIPPRARIRGKFVFRESGIACGIPVAMELFGRLDRRISLNPLKRDGQAVQAGQGILEVFGPAEPILAGERISLNFLQRLSGIATQTGEWKDRMGGSRALLLDTRKTTPGWRHLEKYAVRAGGGVNHRLSLSDHAMIKDNHIQILRALDRGGPREWVSRIRGRYAGVQVALEVESLEEFREAVEAGADIILLDNMAPGLIARAVGELRERPGKRPLLEASGGINAGNLQEFAGTGVDRISVGALTHSAVALDIGFDLMEVQGEKYGA